MGGDHENVTNECGEECEHNVGLPVPVRSRDNGGDPGTSCTHKSCLCCHGGVINTDATVHGNDTSHPGLTELNRR